MAEVIPTHHEYDNSNNTILYVDPPYLEAIPDPHWQLFLIVIYSATSLSSFMANMITIGVLIRGDHINTELWKFLLNLSIADIVMGIFCIPFTYTNYMYGHWIFPLSTCRVVNFLQVCSVSVSIWTLTIIGIDRFYAIVYPFKAHFWLRQHKLAVIVLIWLLGSMIGFPIVIYTDTHTFEFNDTTYNDCRETFSMEGGRLYTIFLFMVTFLLPIMILVYVYCRICFYLINTSAPGNADQTRDRVCIDKKMKVIKMLVTIVILFAVLWFPIHLFQLLVYFKDDFQNQKTKLGYYTYVSCYFFAHWLAMAHSLVNPIVYCFMSENFRKSILAILPKCLQRRIHQRLNDVDDCRELNLTQVQSVTCMQSTPLQMTPKVDCSSRATTIINNGSSSINYHNQSNNHNNNNNNNHHHNNRQHSQCIDQDQFV